MARATCIGLYIYVYIRPYILSCTCGDKSSEGFNVVMVMIMMTHAFGRLARVLFLVRALVECEIALLLA